MLANGALVGVTAAIAGGVLGIVGWIVAAPAVEAAAAHRIDRFDLPWGLIVACLAIAVVMATAAAWWPARTMARVAGHHRAVRAADAGPPRSTDRSWRRVACSWSASSPSPLAQPVGDHVRPLPLIAGVVAVVLGVVLAAPAAIRALAAPAAHLPFAARLALRDLARYQARAAAALAAITLGLGIAVSVVALAQANVAHGDQGNLSDRQLRLGRPVRSSSAAAEPGPSRARPARRPGRRGGRDPGTVDRLRPRRRDRSVDADGTRAAAAGHGRHPERQRLRGARRGLRRHARAARSATASTRRPPTTRPSCSRR